MKPVRFHHEAEDEAEEAIDWFAAKDPKLGQALRDELAISISRIANNPRLYPKHPKCDARKSVMQRFPYNLFYVEEDADIWIVAVAHQKRKPDYWLGRVSDI